MATLGTAFDFSNVEQPASNYDPVPAGTYVGEVIATDIRDTKAGTGKYVSLQFKITEGDFENRRVFTNINFVNQNQTAQSIGQAQLASLCAAVGLKGALEDTSELHDTPVQAKIVIESDRTGQYGDRNTIRTFLPLTARAGNPSPVQAKAAPASSGGGNKAPWAK
jgi:hypothetical protein